MLPRLLTIPISHYGERARWAMDLAGVDYQEEHHLQMFSWLAAYAAGGGKTLPVLVTGDGTFTDSADILAWASERSDVSLFPPDVADEVRLLGAELAGDFGVESRRVVYDWAFREDTMIGYNVGRASPLQEAILKRGLPVAKSVLRRYLDVTPEAVHRATATVDRVFDEIAKRLDGRRYLCGDVFTAADLTFASLAAPCILPERYGVPLPLLDEIAEEARARVLRWRAHPAGQFALRLYDQRPTPRGRYLHALRRSPHAPGFPA